MQTICLNAKTILVTGAAGFIGSNLILELFRCAIPINIIGIDNLNEYYDVYVTQPEDAKWRLDNMHETYLQDIRNQTGHLSEEILLIEVLLILFLKTTNQIL